MMKNLKIKVGENLNLGYEVVDGWGGEDGEKGGVVWRNEKGEEMEL